MAIAIYTNYTIILLKYLCNTSKRVEKIMKRLIYYILLFTLTTQTIFNFATTITPTLKKTSNTTSSIKINFELEPNDFIYKEYIQLSVDDPNIILSEWQSNREPITYYDSNFKDTKKIYNENFTITVQAHYDPNKIHDKINMRVDYLSHKKGSFGEKIIPITLNENKPNNFVENNNRKNEPRATKNVTPPQKTAVQRLAQKATSWKEYITQLIENTDKPWIRIILIFLLGLLVSLTPCIYPMIPITVGILQSQAEKSFIRNFLAAFFYTLGLSATFSLLGLLAAFAGKQIGSLMTNPIIIVPVIVLLIYVALSLFGMYTLYIPKFMQKKNKIYSGSLISAFVFGLISGTVASPCVSPALILVLTIVTKMKSLLWGFFLLLTFGFGMSMPLLVIGTFSTSLNLLPKAGSWMSEVKNIIGFLLFGMCFYFLNFIIPWHALLWTLSLFLFFSGIFYLINAQRNQNRLRKTKTIVGIILIASSVFFVFKGFQALIIK